MSFARFLLLLIILAPLATIAQSGDILSQIERSLVVTVSPDSPKPSEQVTLHFGNTVFFNVENSYIVWSLDGKRELEGVGETEFTFTTGALGSLSLVDVSISPEGLSPIRRQLLIIPSGVDIIFEAETYTPPFYKGKAGFTEEAGLVLAAIPHVYDENGRKLPPASLTYKWSRNGNIVGISSGEGKSSLRFKGSYLAGTENIKVEVTSAGNTVKATASLVLKPENPKVLVYENNPLYGIIYNRAISDQFRLLETEVSLTAIPYFFSKQPESGNIIMEWLVNGSPFAGESGDTITLRNEAGTSGKSSVEISVNNLKERFQQAEENLLINFGN